MVHALEKIQQLLKTDGILLDIHPTNEPAVITVRLHEQFIPAGWVNESDDYVEYEWADEALQHMIDSERFTLERAGTFEFVWHADSMNDLRAYLAEEWHDAIIDDITAMRVEELLKLPIHNKEILVSEAIRIAQYRRVGARKPRPYNFLCRYNTASNAPPPTAHDLSETVKQYSSSPRGSTSAILVLAGTLRPSCKMPRSTPSSLHLITMPSG